MIGVSPSYVPSDYHDVQAAMYLKSYSQPHDDGSTGAHSNNSGYYTAQQESYTSPTYGQYSASQLPQQSVGNHYPRQSQSVSPRRTGYEGWKNAGSDSNPTPTTYPGQTLTPAGMASSPDEFKFSLNMGGPSVSQTTSPQYAGLQKASYASSAEGSGIYPATSGYGLTGVDQNGTPDSSYFSSPPQGYDPQVQHYPQQPTLFSSPPRQPQPYSTSVATEIQRLSNGDVRRIAGTARAQKAASTSRLPVATTGLQPTPGRGSGFSSVSGGSTSSMQPPPNPYSSFNTYQRQPPAPHQHTMTNIFNTSSAPNAKKRGRQSLEVPTIGHANGNNNALHTHSNPPQSVPQPVAAGKLPVRFEPTTATFEDSSDSDGESDDGQPEPKSAKGRKGKITRKGTAGGMARLPGACKNCKRLKMKCMFESDMDLTCKRCRDGGKECIVEGRKQRVPSNKREQLMNLLREKDKVIDALLRAVHTPAKLMPIAFHREVSPSATSQGPSFNADKTNGLPPPPPAATTTSKDIYAWLAASSVHTKSPHKSDASVVLEDSSDEEEAGGRAGIIDVDARAKSTTLSETSAAGASGRSSIPVPRPKEDPHPDHLDVLSSASSANQLKKERRPSTGELPKMHAVPPENTPFGLFAEMSLDSQTAEEREQERERQRKKLASFSNSSLASSFAEGVKRADDGAESAQAVPPVPDLLEDEALGPANKNYWRPGPTQNIALRRLMNERNPPELLASGLINLNDVDNLFKIFYDRLNVFLSILDPVIHTPSDVFARCPFLFTVICAVSSRYYTEKPHVYNVAMHFAKVAAAMALVEGAKCVEICQAYIIMSVYPQAARRWEEDRAWLYLRLAIGMATDLSLHVPSPTTKFIDERHEREILSRTRTWIICFNLDRSAATQFGKPPSIREDIIIRHAATWYKKSPHNHCYDIHMVAYTALLKLVASFLAEVYSDPESPTGLNKNLDFVPVTTKYDQQLTAFREATRIQFSEEADRNDPACHYRNELLPFLVSYSRLVMFSFGFQQSFQRHTLDRHNIFFTACHESASNVLRIVIESQAPSGYLRYAADGHFVFAAFASAFLLKLLRPQFVHLLDADQQSRILALVQRLIKTLASSEVAVDDRHTPKLYSRFLDGLLLKRNQEIAEASAVKEPPVPNGKAAVTARQPSIDTTMAKAETIGSHPMSPTIQVQAPEEEGNMIHSQFFNQPMVQGVDGYQYSTAASSTIDGPGLDNATHYSGEDVLMQGDDGWIATMGALDNPGFWTNGMLPGFNWPSPPDTAWQVPISTDMNLSHQPNHHTDPQQYASLMSMNGRSQS